MMPTTLIKAVTPPAWVTMAAEGVPVGEDAPDPLADAGDVLEAVLATPDVLGVMAELLHTELCAKVKELSSTISAH